MSLKKLVIINLLILLVGCNSSSRFDADYYESVTKIKIPDYKVVTTKDNSEFLTITILDIDKKDCPNFIKEYKFKSVNEQYIPSLMGLGFLDSMYRKLPESKNLLINQLDKVKGQAGWRYLIDTSPADYIVR